MIRKSPVLQLKSLWLLVVLAAGFVAIGVMDRPALAQDSIIEALEREYIGIAENARPAVVEISATGSVEAAGHPELPPGMEVPPEFRDWFDNPNRPARPMMSAGSGFVIDEDGWILTNSHVVRGADKITVRDSNGEEYDVVQHFIDPLTDVGVLKIEAGKKLTALPMGDSSAVPVGSIVVALGNPFGEGISFTTGVVSQLGGEIAAPQRDEQGKNVRTITGLIQTDAAINPGNSGGPLLNISGEVVGITTAIVSRSGGNEGVAFAIPINTAKQIATQLMETGKVVRGWIGIGLLEKPLAEMRALGAEDGGALVSEVRPDGPAATSDLKGGDIIVSVDATPDGEHTPIPVRSPQDLIQVVEFAPPGTQVTLDVVRMGAALQVNVMLGEIPGSISGSETAALDEIRETPLGLTIGPVTADAATELGIEGATGALIEAVEPTSPAAQLLFPGDVVLGVNGKPVTSPADFTDLIGGLSKGDTAVFLFKRKAGPTLLTDTATVVLGDNR